MINNEKKCWDTFEWYSCRYMRREELRTGNTPQRVLSLTSSLGRSQVKVWDDNRNASNLDGDWVLGLCDLLLLIFPSSGVNSYPWNSSSADLFITGSCPLLGYGVLKIFRFTGGQIFISTKSVAKPTVSSVSAEVLGLLYPVITMFTQSSSDITLLSPCSEFELWFVFSEDCWQHSQDDYSRYYLQ